jgi:hypothetical protein
MLESALSYLSSAVLAALIQIVVVLGPGLVLGLIMHYASRFIQNQAVAVMGRAWYLGVFGWLGTTVHEIGHAFFCLIFGHKISQIKLFSPDPETGTLGYVKHSYNTRSLYQLTGNFFIGSGPILLGMALIFLLSYGLLGLNPFNLAAGFHGWPSAFNSWEAVMRLFQALGSSSLNLLAAVFSVSYLSQWQFYVFVYLAFAVGSSITLSPPDMRGALKGFAVILILILIFNLATVWIGDFTTRLIAFIAGYARVFYAVMFLILLLNIIVGVLVLLPVSLLHALRSKSR